MMRQTTPKPKKLPAIGSTVEYRGDKGKVSQHRHNGMLFEARMNSGKVYHFTLTDDWKVFKDAEKIATEG